MISGIARTVDAMIRAGDAMRRRPWTTNGHAGHKEWLHFSIAAREVELIVNFSIAEERRGETASEKARVVIIVRGAVWDGDVDTYDAEDVFAPGGSLDLRFGQSFVSYRDGRFYLKATLRHRGIHVEAELAPTTLGTLVNNIRLGEENPINWFLVPRLEASGSVRVGERLHVFERAPAYHDHNWGCFAWGRNFSWIWGYAHASRRASPWSIVVNQMSDRNRTSDYVRALLLWKGARQTKLFGNSDVSFATRGFLRPTRILKLPRAMALLAPEVATNVPKTVEIRGQQGKDVIELEFVSTDVCQVITPNDHDMGITIINEIGGDLALSGIVAGERVTMRGRSTLELLGG